MAVAEQDKVGTVLIEGSSEHIRVIPKQVAHVAPMPRPVSEAPGNAFLQFAGNEFKAWSISGRVDVQLPSKPIEAAPMPRALN
jgi:hypothetical protein